MLGYKSNTRLLRAISVAPAKVGAQGCKGRGIGRSGYPLSRVVTARCSGPTIRTVPLALEPADCVGAKSDDVLGAEVINITRGGEADRRGEGAEADREIEIAV